MSVYTIAEITIKGEAAYPTRNTRPWCRDHRPVRRPPGRRSPSPSPVKGEGASDITVGARLLRPILVLRNTHAVTPNCHPEPK